VGQFLNTALLFVRDGDFVEAMTKTVVFSTVFLLIALNEGLNARGGSEGIGRAATQAVVRGSVSVIALDFALTYGFYAL
jgi:phospholipid/cholesterol/gamma-HCH transport system permease protein